MREIRRARVQLTSLGIEPGTHATLNELRDEALRPQRLSEQLPVDATGFAPRNPLKLRAKEVAEALRSAGRGSAPDLA